jgi:4-alpha-glucanotransferase
MRRNGQALPKERQAGVCLHITSLPGRFGIGEIGEAAFRFIDALIGMKLHVWQFLPLGPTAFGDSPYQPLSTFAGNELLVDIEALDQAGLLKSGEAAVLRRLPREIVAYGELIPKKIALLELAASRFPARASSDARADFDRFLDEHDQRWLHDYALFRVIKARHGGRPWPEWKPPLMRHDQAALRQIEARAGVQLERIKTVQFLFHQQWRRLQEYADERAVLLFGDMPMFIALDSSDAWANREILRLNRNGKPDLVAGVPPDYFSANGQLWGNPLYDWDTHATDGYRWWIDRLRRALTMTDLVRIDHFRGFDAYWAVSSRNVTARAGQWLPGPGDAIFKAMHDVLGELPIVAEDLGVITKKVKALRKRHRLPGMKVLQFELEQEEFDLADIGEHCVCYTGTHDNDTAVGWFRGSPNDRRSAREISSMQTAVLEITGGLPETIHLDLIRLAFSSAARLAIAPLQDYLGLGSEARLNAPGTSAGNWRWRMESDQIQPALLNTIGEMVEASGRGKTG